MSFPIGFFSLWVRESEGIMIKTIEICGKPYEMKANLHIYEIYKNTYGKELSDTIIELFEKLNNIENNMGTVGYIVKECVQIAWIMIKELDDSFKPLDEWEKELDDELVGAWLSEVLALAFSPFRRREIPQDHKEPKQ